MCPVGTRVAALRHLSAAHAAQLPDELCLAILLRWGGMRHPTVSVLVTDPELKAEHEQYYDNLLLAHCPCGSVVVSGKPDMECGPLLRQWLSEHDTFRPTLCVAVHSRRITVNAEGGYRDRDDTTLDKFGQAWCWVGRCGKETLWHRLWYHMRGIPCRPFWAWQPHTWEYSLAEFLKRASTTRLGQDYYELTGEHLDQTVLFQQPDEFRRTLIRNILAARV